VRVRFLGRRDDWRIPKSVLKDMEEAERLTRHNTNMTFTIAFNYGGQTEIVDDVSLDPRYLACFTTTRSEIVVPIHHEGKVVGEIDVDGSDPAAFGPPDARFLEEVAALLAALRPREDEPV